MNFEIISANYNNSLFLPAFFESIIKSSKQPSKVIIVDDGSTDNSVEIIRSFGDRINTLLIINEKNIGFANSLNIAILELKESLFARLDPDDCVHPDRFLLQTAFLQTNDKIDVVGTNVNYVLDGRFKKRSDVILSSEKIINSVRKGLIPIIHGSIMGKVEVLNEFKYKQDFVPAEDYDLFAYFVYNGYSLANMNEALTEVNVHGKSISNDLKFSTIKKRFKIAKSYFNFDKHFFGQYFEYIHQFNYRRYLFEKKIASRYLYLLISASVMPIKSFNKFLKIVYDKF